MERIIVQATTENGIDSAFRLQSDALVDTGAAYLTLPSAWRDRLRKLTLLDTVSVQTATQAVMNGDIYGPVLLRIGNFRPVLIKVLLIEKEPFDGRYDPLIGYIPLKQAQATVDMVGHRLVKFSRVDLKRTYPPMSLSEILSSIGRTHRMRAMAAFNTATSEKQVAKRALQWPLLMKQEQPPPPPRRSRTRGRNIALHRDSKRRSVAIRNIRRQFNETRGFHLCQQYRYVTLADILIDLKLLTQCPR